MVKRSDEEIDLDAAALLDATLGKLLAMQPHGLLRGVSASGRKSDGLTRQLQGTSLGTLSNKTKRRRLKAAIEDSSEEEPNKHAPPVDKVLGKQLSVQPAGSLHACDASSDETYGLHSQLDGTGLQSLPTDTLHECLTAAQEASKKHA